MRGIGCYIFVVLEGCEGTVLGKELSKPSWPKRPANCDGFGVSDRNRNATKGHLIREHDPAPRLLPYSIVSRNSKLVDRNWKVETGKRENKKHRNTILPAPLGIEPNTN